MLIHSKFANLLRKAESPLFYKPAGSKADRIKLFYKLLKPILYFLKEEFQYKYNLESHESESELFLLISNIFNGFKPDKSSIIPYLSKFIPYYISKHHRKLNKLYINEEVPSGLIKQEEDYYEIDSEFYLKQPYFLFNKQFLGKVFTFKQKYIINRILMLDKQDLNIKSLAENLSISRKSAKTILNDISKQMEELL